MASPDPAARSVPPARSGHASILDVAALAGVSPATVSRSLRGMPNVSPGTRQRVLAAAQELSYVVSPNASRLKSGQTRAVGVVLPFVTRWFYSNAVAGACDVLLDQGYDVLLYHLGSPEGRDRFFERMPLARRVDAVMTVSLPLQQEHLRALRSLGLPLVSIGSDLPDVTRVRIDDLSASRSAMNHLLHQGHERIAMLGGLSEEWEPGFSSSRDRREGYRQALTAAGIEIRDDLHLAGTHGVGGGAEGMAQMLTGEVLPTAVFAEYDELAIGALRTLRRAGIRVPEDISIVGIDNHEMAAVVDLTTVAQPVQEQGSVAARLLLDLLAGRLDEQTEVVLPTRLLVRTTTGRSPHLATVGR